MKPLPKIIVQLVHIDGPLKGEIQEFTDPVIDIGRHPDCQVRFPREATIISRKHARITREGNSFKLIDTGSGNGTFVNGKEITETIIKSGNVMMFAQDGPKVSFLTKFVEATDEQKEEVIPSPPKEQDKPPIFGSKLQESMAPPPPKPVEPQPVEGPYPQPPPSAKTGTVKAPLIVQYGPMLKDFKSVPVTIGKGPASECVLEHPALLDRHAEIYYDNGQYWVKDLTGKKLVAVEGLPVGFQAPLSHEGSLSLTPEGPAFKFLDGGRLMEIEQPPPENLQTPHSPTQENNSDNRPKTGGSFIKKIFR